MFPATEYVALQLQLVLLPSAGPAPQRRCLVMAPLATALRDLPNAATGLRMSPCAGLPKLPSWSYPNMSTPGIPYIPRP